MTAYTISKSRRTYRVIQSDAVGPTEAVQLDLIGVSDFTHMSLSVQWLDVSGDQGSDTVGPGTWLVEIRTSKNAHWEDVDTIDLSSLATVDWEAPTIGVLVTPDSLPVGVVTWKVTVTANRT